MWLFKAYTSKLFYNSCNTHLFTVCSFSGVESLSLPWRWRPWQCPSHHPRGEAPPGILLCASAPFYFLTERISIWSPCSDGSRSSSIELKFNYFRKNYYQFKFIPNTIWFKRSHYVNDTDNSNNRKKLYFNKAFILKIKIILNFIYHLAIVIQF